jgi:hypothetical protein
MGKVIPKICKGKKPYVEMHMPNYKDFFADDDDKVRLAINVPINSYVLTSP